MRTYSCIIIDDEELSRDLLDNFVGRVSHLEMKGKFSNPLAALQELRLNPVDIIYLDIQMPEMTGIEFMKTLSGGPAVIFTTAYDRYAVEGFELSATDYLLKPFNFTRFLQATNKATAVIELQEKANQKSTPQQENDADQPDFLLINADQKVHKLYYKDITYIQSLKEYVVYHTADGRKVMALGSLKNLEEKLPTTDFVRAHKSYIASIKKVTSLERHQLNLGDLSIPVGGSYRNELRQRFLEGS